MLRIRFVAVVCLVVSGCTAPGDGLRSVKGKVSKVHDGDSIHITPRGQKRVIIRLAGIDAPEIKQTYGVSSRDALRAMILNQSVVAECHKADRYRRQVCVVYAEGEDVNLQMVEQGMAWHYKQYQNEQTRRQRRQYSKAEKSAKREQRGLWRQEHVEPWVFRQSKG